MNICWNCGRFLDEETLSESRGCCPFCEADQHSTSTSHNHRPSPLHHTHLPRLIQSHNEDGQSVTQFIVLVRPSSHRSRSIPSAPVAAHRRAQLVQRSSHVHDASSFNLIDLDVHELDQARSKLSRGESYTNILPPIEGSSAKKPSTGHISVGSNNRKKGRRNSSESGIEFYTCDALRWEFKKCEKRQDFSRLVDHYLNSFSSFKCINKALLMKEGKAAGEAIDTDLMACTYETLMKCPQEVQRSVLKAIFFCLMSEQKTADSVSNRQTKPRNVRALYILLMNPQFKKVSSYEVFAQVLRSITMLSHSDQNLLALWLASVSITNKKFSSLISTIQEFISVRLFPTKPNELPPIERCRWWIQSAVKCLAIFVIANDEHYRVPLTTFYNSAIDKCDILNDFYNWQSNESNTEFYYCQYPFLLSLTCKRTLMEGYAEHQMIRQARESIITNLMNFRLPNANSMFLTIVVRREHLLEDSLNELIHKQANLRKKVHIQFAGESGYDMGGLTKEWFLLLTKIFFEKDYAMFVEHRDSHVHWFSTLAADDTNTDSLQEYKLVGMTMGLAMYNGVILDLKFPPCIYNKLLSPAIMQIREGNASNFGRLNDPTLNDLAGISKTVAKSLQELLDYDGDVENDLGLTFEVSIEEYGIVKNHELKKNGRAQAVTNRNRKEFVESYIEWFLNDAIRDQFAAFYIGFHSVAGSNVMKLIRPEEIELLVCGSVHFDISQLEAMTSYDGFKTTDKTIRHFWEIVTKMSEKRQRSVLRFITGSDRVPCDGFSSLTLKITKAISADSNVSIVHLLPMAKTCFNQLIIPDYQDKRLMKEKLLLALTHGEGFGLQ